MLLMLVMASPASPVSLGTAQVGDGGGREQQARNGVHHAFAHAQVSVVYRYAVHLHEAPMRHRHGELTACDGRHLHTARELE
jgi:hypothetical protein